MADGGSSATTTATAATAATAPVLSFSVARRSKASAAAPYWDDPKNEAANLESVANSVMYVGGEKLVFYIAKSHNRNTVLYLYDGAKLSALWLVLCPETRAKDHGVPPTDTTSIVTRPLTAAEEPYFGASLVREGSQVFVRFNAFSASDAFKDFKAELVRDGDGLPALRAELLGKGRVARVDCAYVQLQKSTVLFPEFITIHGVETDGSPVQRRVEVD